MSSRYKIRDQNAMYFLTMTTAGWVDVFTRKECRNFIIESLAYCQKNKGLILYAYVIMSNHIHIIASAEYPNELSSIIRDFKKFTAKKVKFFLTNSHKESRRIWMRQVLEWYAKRTAGKKEFTLWKSGSHPKELFTPKIVEQKLNYIHNNPVADNIVSKPENFIYSSASNYILNEGILEVTLIEPSCDIGFIFY